MWQEHMLMVLEAVCKEYALVALLWGTVLQHVVPVLARVAGSTSEEGMVRLVSLQMLGSSTTFLLSAIPAAGAGLSCYIS